jgi:uncharacterized protein (DUF1330 family)
MPAYIIVDIDVHDTDGYEAYKQAAGPSLAAFGGRYLVRGGASRVLEGGWTPHRMVVLSFPSAERAFAWWDSPEYRPIRAIRERTARTSMILVEGVAP